MQFPWHSTPEWRPTEFSRFEAGLDTSMGTGRIVTDAGKAYIKAMGNRQGPHLLAVELIATRLAHWFKLSVLDHAVIIIDSDVDEIPFLRGGFAATGPAFVTRAIQAHSWGGSADELKPLVNSLEISRLVVFDSWVRNCDRYPPDLTERKPNYDNVLLEELTGDEAERLRLIAMDHTHCFGCGRDLDARFNQIDRVRDDRVYGLFPGFVPWIDRSGIEAAMADLSMLDKEMVAEIVHDLPAEWDVSAAAKSALADLICRRAAFLNDYLPEAVGHVCWPDAQVETQGE